MTGEGRSRQHWASTVARLGVAAALGGSAGACFDGASALGLPCRTDADCGQGQSCIQDICGGPQGTSSQATDTSIDPSSTSASSEPTTSDDTSDSSSSGGTPPSCGNGVLDEGEECDPGPSNSAECDADCTPVICGDGHLNEAAGEQCDDGNESSVDDCSVECLPTLFHDDMENGGKSMATWTVENPTWGVGADAYSLPIASMWQVGLPGMPSVGVWFSGPYSSDSGTTRLISPPIMFPPEVPPGTRFELQFRHTTRFDGNGMLDTCQPVNIHSDGAVVWFQEMGAEPRPVAPPPGEGIPLDDLGGCVELVDPANPIYELPMSPPVYGGTTGEPFEQVRVPLDGVAGTVGVLIFEMSYDCYNCWEDAPPMGTPPIPGWVVDDIVVGPFLRP